MMNRRSIFTKLRDLIMGPPLPAHLRSQMGFATPWYVRMWRSVRPPEFEGRPRELNRSQGRLIRVALGVVVTIGVGTGLYFYLFAGREERSQAVFQDGLKSVAKVDYKQAIPKFTQAISIWPGNALAYLHRGNSHAALGKGQRGCVATVRGRGPRWRGCCSQAQKQRGCQAGKTKNEIASHGRPRRRRKGANGNSRRLKTRAKMLFLPPSLSANTRNE